MTYLNRDNACSGDKGCIECCDTLISKNLGKEAFVLLRASFQINFIEENKLEKQEKIRRV